MPEVEPRLISAHRMEAIMRHDDMEWATQCFISFKATLDMGQQFQVFLRTYPQAFPQIEGLSISLSWRVSNLLSQHLIAIPGIIRRR